MSGFLTLNFIKNKISKCPPMKAGKTHNILCIYMSNKKINFHMKLLQRITAKDVMYFTGLSRTTAENELKDLKKEYNVMYPKFIHYLMYNHVNPKEYYEIMHIND